MASEIGDSIYLQISVRDIVEGMRDRVLTTTAVSVYPGGSGVLF